MKEKSSEHKKHKHRESEATENEPPKKNSSLTSRLKTAAIFLPILIFMLYYKVLYTLLMIIVIFFTYREFYTIEKNILKLLFKDDHFADITWNTLISSPLFTLFFMICPIILFIFEKSEILACTVTLSFVILWRIKNFMLVHNFLLSPININKLIKDKEGIKDELSNHNQIMSNPIDYFFSKKNKEARTPEPIEKELIKNKPDTNDSPSISLDESSKTNFKSIKVFNSCLILIMLDVLYFFMYVLPLCLGISIHNLNNSFVYLLMVVIIAYQSDNGALFAGNRFGKIQFGSPVTPNKTLEGVCGAFILGISSAFVYRFVVTEIFKIELMSLSKFSLYVILSVFCAIIGDFFESFLKRCGNLKDSGNLLPGHGGLLDRVDSLTLCIPMAYYFMLMT